MVLHRCIGKKFTQTVYKRFNATHILRRLIVHLFGLANDYAFNRFLLHVIKNKIYQFCSRDSSQATGNYLHLIRYSQPGPLFSIIYSQQTRHNNTISNCEDNIFIPRVTYQRQKSNKKSGRLCFQTCRLVSNIKVLLIVEQPSFLEIAVIRVISLELCAGLSCLLTAIE